KGSKKRSAFEIAEGMDRIGASVNAYTTKEYTFFYTRALDYQILGAADILFDMIKNPRLDENDIETEKGVIAEEIAMCEDDPSDVCFETNESAIFEGDSIALQILGSKESIVSFQKENFKDQIKRYYVPERMVIGISGNFDEEKMLEKIKEYFADLVCTNNPVESKPIAFKQAFTLKKRSFEQTHIVISFDGVGIEHEDLHALQVCLFILGNGSSSRLNQRIREQLGLVYEIGAWLGRYLGGGYIAVSMSLSPDSQQAALEETCKIIRIFASSLTETELATAKEKLISSLIMSREQPQSQLSSFGYSQLMLSKFIDDDSIINGIRAITLEQAKCAAQKYLRLENAAFTAVGKVKSKKFYKDILTTDFQ
ncbi:MAG: insulinase family protein, partial [Ruminococcus sp.]|nr:insulinase family protein [Ruminococcus sp.]